MSKLEEVWRRRTDDQLVEAAQCLDEYTDEGRDVIRAELRRRGSITKLRPASEKLRNRDRSLDNKMASIGARLACQILDSMVAFVPLVLSTIGGIPMVWAMALGVFYLLFADGFKNGQSYAKRLMGIAVVNATTGEPCTFFASFLRNVCLLLLGPLDSVLIFDEGRERLGDKIAKTIVITTRRSWWTDS